MRAALLTMAEAAANPADHSVISGRAPAGAVLRLGLAHEWVPSLEVGNPSRIVVRRTTRLATS